MQMSQSSDYSVYLDVGPRARGTIVSVVPIGGGTGVGYVDQVSSLGTLGVMPTTQPPLVSVVIPAYQAARWIAEALDLVLAQTFHDYEIIVVNDGSPDTVDLERVLQRYRERIIYLCQENRGLAGARNTGIRAASGRYIAPLDADDLWEPEFLAEQVAMLEADPALDMVYADGTGFRRCARSRQNPDGAVALGRRSDFRAAGDGPVHCDPLHDGGAAGGVGAGRAV